MIQPLKKKTPEDLELEKKRTQLAELENELAERELELATLQAEVADFERQYIRVVGVRYAELDDLEARIAEAEAKLRPEDVAVRERAAEARAKAQDSTKATSQIASAREETEKFAPSDNLRRLYREVAKTMHPDMATDEQERARRHKLMVEANRAYEEGDEARLQALLDGWHSSPEAVKGEGTGAELVRTIRKVAQVEARLKAIEQATSQIKGTDLFKMKAQVDQAEAQGADVLADMARALDYRTELAHKRLAELSKRD